MCIFHISTQSDLCLQMENSIGNFRAFLRWKGIMLDNVSPGIHSTSQDIFKRFLLCDAIARVPPAILWSIEED